MINEDIMGNSPIFGLGRLLARVIDPGQGGRTDDDVGQALALLVAPTDDQDPILDHAHGKVTSITVSAVVLTPPAGCKFADFYAAADVWLRADAAAAVVPTYGMTGGVPAFVGAGQTRTLAVVAGVDVQGISSSGSAVLVVAIPHKARS